MKSREHYSPEFHAEAVRLVLEQGLSQAEATRRLGIAKGTLANWIVTAKGDRTNRLHEGVLSPSLKQKWPGYAKRSHKPTWNATS
ncbi:transposase IS3/IS911 family protein [Aeromonas hydrophila ML09-119]|uniref:Transposase IS3 n=1 Tax=Aeromonas hydrophila TaxID=644 RepID=A0A068CLA1_AERHY|nr:transposase IS3/IS911 family protein [Aeromonas hydrophila ML09-119]AID21742.1 transposase IS3 [Aeromonas hydrophila]AID21756.1 transposase IS3 [Aeromonas hydrophila]CAD7544009.1 hypothetical protein KBAHV27_29590 [Aeromonas hydrophila]CAD7544108.1 hypothetical protein KBAHV42_29690 [Aeromonas hydrophila]